MHVNSLLFLVIFACIANGHECIEKEIAYIYGNISNSWKTRSMYASCKSCDKLISQGGDSTKVYNTTNIVNHIKSTCNEAYKEYQQKYTEHQENEKKKK